MRMEIRAGEGGSDAEHFASELAAAIAKHSGISEIRNDSMIVLDRL